jgi:hypothetical protein
MQRSLRVARDEHLARVVAMVDGLADRTQADVLIDPLRPRLALLRPPRPVRLPRLLFMPLDPVIVPSTQWKPGRPSLPRSVLPALAHTVQAALGSHLAKTPALAGPWSSEDQPALRAAGGLLWPAAARALAGAVTPPSNWAVTGLPAVLFESLAGSAAAVLEHAVGIDRLAEEARFGLKPDDEAIDAMLNRAASRGAEAWALLIATLLGHLADAAPIVARLAADLGNSSNPAVRSRAEQVADALLDRLDAPSPSAGLIAGTDLARAGTEVRRAALLLDTLDRPGTSAGRRQRVQGLRRQLDGSSRARFQAGLEKAFMAPLRTRVSGGEQDAVEELEAAVRALRDLEGAGRRLGDPAFYDRLLADAARQVEGLPEQANFSRVDKVRLVELISGADQALALLDS